MTTTREELMGLAIEQDTLAKSFKKMRLMKEARDCAVRAVALRLAATQPNAGAVKEACAKIARAHKGSAAAKRRARGRQFKFLSDEAVAEIQAEERGEDIASEIIAAAIDKLDVASVQPAGDVVRTFVRKLVDDPNSASGKSMRDVEVQPGPSDPIPSDPVRGDVPEWELALFLSERRSTGAIHDIDPVSLACALLDLYEMRRR